jgi:hypothetical protein
VDAEQETEEFVQKWKQRQPHATTAIEEKTKGDKIKSILKKDAAKQIMEMNIHTDPLGYVYYN